MLDANCLYYFSCRFIGRQKKKSRNYIIPASHFKVKLIEETIDATEEPKEKKQEIRSNTEVLETVSNSITKPQISKIRRHSALSIKSLTTENISTKKKAKVHVDSNNLPSNPFTNAQLQELWKTSITNFQEKGEKLLASLMSSCNPIAQQNLLKIELPNKLMKVDLENSKQKILPFFREELQNYKIDFDIYVNEKIVEKVAYKPQEKYAYLKDKNELISVLKTKFNLDF